MNTGDTARIVTRGASMTGTFAAFVSYSHDDDEDESGFITEFAKRLERSLHRVTGRTDLAVFHDRTAIQWGDAWRDRIEEGLDASVALIAVVTPRYLTSSECRKEFEDFQRRRGASGWLLPLYYLEVDDFETLDDPLVAAVRANQYVDWRELREVANKSRSLKVRQEIESLAKRISRLRREPAAAADFPSGPMPEPSHEFRARTAGDPAAEDWLDAVVAAQGALEDEEYGLARALLLNALDFVDEPTLWHELAVVDWYDGACANAVEEFELALEKGVPRDLVLHGLGQVRVELGEFEQGVADLTEVIEGPGSDEDLAYARSSRALGLGGLGRYEEALRELRAAEEVTPGNAWLHFNRARILDWQDDSAAAIASYVRSLVCAEPALNRQKRMFSQERLKELGWAG
jgi:tetratricopeptide (TPR) repeat protein